MCAMWAGNQNLRTTVWAEGASSATILTSSEVSAGCVLLSPRPGRPRPRALPRPRPLPLPRVPRASVLAPVSYTATKTHPFCAGACVCVCVCVCVCFHRATTSALHLAYVSQRTTTSIAHHLHHLLDQMAWHPPAKAHEAAEEES